MRLIDADALREYLLANFSYCAGIEKALANAPTIDPVKHGRWIMKEDKYYWWCECSECGSQPMKNRFNNLQERSNYCPNCGARMDGDENAVD